jgi:hypothetical protein
MAFVQALVWPGHRSHAPHLVRAACRSEAERIDQQLLGSNVANETAQTGSLGLGYGGVSHQSSAPPFTHLTLFGDAGQPEKPQQRAGILF